MPNPPKHTAPLRSANKNFFLEQWERVQRWKDRCSKTPELDFYEAFFINAYHLKDWLKQWYTKNGNENSTTTLDNDFSTKLHLKILQDICNGSKHFTLERNPAISSQYTITNEYLGDNQAHKVILIGGNKYPLKNLVNDVYNYWDEYLTDSGLLNLKSEISGPLIP